MRTRIVCSARASRRATRGLQVVEQRAARQSQFGPEVVQMPLQRVVERDALANEALAMVHEQPQIEFGALQLRGRQRVQALAQRRPRDGDRVDADRTSPTSQIETASPDPIAPTCDQATAGIRPSRQRADGRSSAPRRLLC
jgi:hypothetical protein